MLVESTLYLHLRHHWIYSEILNDIIVQRNIYRNPIPTDTHTHTHSPMDTVIEYAFAHFPHRFSTYPIRLLINNKTNRQSTESNNRIGDECAKCTHRTVTSPQHMCCVCVRRKTKWKYLSSPKVSVCVCVCLFSFFISFFFGFVDKNREH